MTYVIDRGDLARLAEEVTGPVLAPGDKDYPAETATWNMALIEHPAVVVGATSAADVRAAVRFAAANGMPVAPVATGHGAPMAADEAVMINLSRINGVDVDVESRTATIGCPWRRRARPPRNATPARQPSTSCPHWTCSG